MRPAVACFVLICVCSPACGACVDLGPGLDIFTLLASKAVLCDDGHTGFTRPQRPGPPVRYHVRGPHISSAAEVLFCLPAVRCALLYHPALRVTLRVTVHPLAAGTKHRSQTSTGSCAILCRWTRMHRTSLMSTSRGAGAVPSLPSASCFPLCACSLPWAPASSFVSYWGCFLPLSHPCAVCSQCCDLLMIWCSALLTHLSHWAKYACLGISVCMRVLWHGLFTTAPCILCLCHAAGLYCGMAMGYYTGATWPQMDSTYFLYTSDHGYRMHMPCCCHCLSPLLPWARDDPVCSLAPPFPQTLGSLE